MTKERKPRVFYLERPAFDAYPFSWEKVGELPPRPNGRVPVAVFRIVIPADAGEVE